MRNIVICCDGTGNEISENISNVLKFYRCLRKTDKTTPHQVVFYDPGVGTLSRPDPWHKLKQDFSAILGLATGYGLDEKVLQAYLFLVRNYQDGDQIYLFGFSRGAYTVRVLAGLIHKVGLISPEQANLAGSGLTSYKQLSGDDPPDPGFDPQALTDGGDSDGPLPATKDDQAAQFARILSTRWPTIRFVGVWDTVASVIVPRPDRFYWPSLEELAYTLHNPSVQTFRQAISIDERRCMFRLKKWDAPQTFMHNRLQRRQIRAAGHIAGVVRRGAFRYRRRLSGSAKRAVEISAALDDRRSGEMRPQSQSGHRPSTGLGRPAQGQPVLLRRAQCQRSAARFADRGVVAARIHPEGGEVQGVAPAPGLFRLLHPGWRAAPDSRGRRDPRIGG
jgi:uncharacterized protein (DUF2235 family)